MLHDATPRPIFFSYSDVLLLFIRCVALLRQQIDSNTYNWMAEKKFGQVISNLDSLLKMKTRRTIVVRIFFLRFSRIRVDLPEYNGKTTDKREQYDGMSGKHLSGKASGNVYCDACMYV